jgi:diguanylate cyclase (GGDEF)-like protein
MVNRSRSCERLDQTLASQRQAHSGVALLYLDLEGFKPIDDRHGHAIGAELLRIVAMRLTRAVRATTRSAGSAATRSLAWWRNL